MDMQIYGSLDRQAKALDLLQLLLEEEFSLLMDRDSDQVTHIEFSIHELLRQLATEKDYIIKYLAGGKVLDYAQMLDESEKNKIVELWHDIDNKEQNCARQASYNTELSLGLLDQSEKILKNLYSKIVPQSKINYTRKGQYNSYRPEAMVFSAQG